MHTCGEFFSSRRLWRKNYYGKGNSVVGAIAPGGVHTNCFPPETLECNLKRDHCYHWQKGPQPRIGHISYRKAWKANRLYHEILRFMLTVRTEVVVIDKSKTVQGPIRSKNQDNTMKDATRGLRSSDVNNALCLWMPDKNGPKVTQTERKSGLHLSDSDTDSVCEKKISKDVSKMKNRLKSSLVY